MNPFEITRVCQRGRNLNASAAILRLPHAPEPCAAGSIHPKTAAATRPELPISILDPSPAEMARHAILQVRRGWAERSQRQNNHGANRDTADGTKQPSQHPIEPAQPDPVNRPASDPSCYAAKQRKHDKHRQEPSEYPQPMPSSHTACTKPPPVDTPMRRSDTRRPLPPEQKTHRKSLGPPHPGRKSPEQKQIPNPGWRNPFHCAVLNRQRPPSELRVSFDIFLARLLRNLRRKAGSRRLLVPFDRFQVVPHVLLVERLLRAARPILVGGPEARGIRR